MNDSSIIKKKICLLGMFGVGKTSLIGRFVYNTFEDTYLSTIGVKVSQKIMPPLKLVNNKFIQHNFLIWDIEGFRKEIDITKKYYTGAAGALVVVDLTRSETINNFEELLNLFKEINPNAKIVLAGNKNDLINDKVKTLSMLDLVAKKEKYDYFLTSAKSGLNVENAFNKLSELLLP